jgi:death-on-curing family protein
VLQRGNFTIGKYLPAISDDWFVSVCECLEYIESTNQYLSLDILEEAARILYKVVKKHDLADSNKRSAVICVYLFCLLNDYVVVYPTRLKEEAKRIAKTKGRENEDLITSRVTSSLREFIEYTPVE